MRSAYAEYSRVIDEAREAVRISAGVQPGHEREDLSVGELFLQTIVNASVTWALIDTPDAPIFALVGNPQDRLGFTNPDNLYYGARFAVDGACVISWNSGLARTFAIQENAGLPGLTEEKGKTLSYINGRDRGQPREKGLLRKLLSLL